MLLNRGSFCWTRAFNEEDNNLCFENCASTFLKKVYEFVNALVDAYVRAGTGSASQRVLGHAVHFDSRFALQNVPPPCGMRWEADPVPALRPRTPGTVLKHVLRADINLVARLCQALIWGGRSQSSGLTIFPIRLSERSRNRTPPAELSQGPPWCYFSEHPAGRRKPRST